jgi:hypothetical protein
MKKAKYIIVENHGEYRIKELRSFLGFEYYSFVEDHIMGILSYSDINAAGRAIHTIETFYKRTNSPWKVVSEYND